VSFDLLLSAALAGDQRARRYMADRTQRFDESAAAAWYYLSLRPGQRIPDALMRGAQGYGAPCPRSGEEAWAVVAMAVRVHRVVVRARLALALPDVDVESLRAAIVDPPLAAAERKRLEAAVAAVGGNWRRMGKQLDPEERRDQPPKGFEKSARLAAVCYLKSWSEGGGPMIGAHLVGGTMGSLDDRPLGLIVLQSFALMGHSGAQRRLGHVYTQPVSQAWYGLVEKDLRLAGAWHYLGVSPERRTQANLSVWGQANALIFPANELKGWEWIADAAEKSSRARAGGGPGGR
jgi:hypothetical protein